MKKKKGCLPQKRKTTGELLSSQRKWAGLDKRQLGLRRCWG